MMYRVAKTPVYAIVTQAALMLSLLGAFIISLSVPMTPPESHRSQHHYATPDEIKQRERARLIEALELEAERMANLRAKTVQDCQFKMGGRHQMPC